MVKVLMICRNHKARTHAPSVIAFSGSTRLRFAMADKADGKKNGSTERTEFLFRRMLTMGFAVKPLLGEYER